MEEFRMGLGEMLYKSWQGCWMLAPSISPQTKLFCLRSASPVSMQGMDDAYLTFLQIASKGFRLFIMGFLNLSCYISTCSANLKTECTSDRSDESWLTSKGKLYLKGKNAASLICFLQVFSIFILNFVSKQSNSENALPCTCLSSEHGLFSRHNGAEWPWWSSTSY